MSQSTLKYDKFPDYMAFFYNPRVQDLSREYSEEEIIETMREIGFKNPRRAQNYEVWFQEDELLFDDSNELHQVIKDFVHPRPRN